MPPHNTRRTHELRSGAARLVRLAAVTCIALAAGSAAMWAQASGEFAAGHRCIHDELQQRVLQSVAERHNGRDTLSAVGLPVVATAPDLDSARGKVDHSLADSTSPQVLRSKDWGELRITVSTDNFTDPQRYCTRAGQLVKDHSGSNVTCTADDILTDAKRDILMNSVIPEALRLHTDRLKVKQVQSSWRVTPMPHIGCGDLKVPQAHLTSGVNNTDFVLYVASVPSKHVLAWAAVCQVFSNDQPAVGVLNVPADKIVSRYDQRVIRMVAPQIAHALGFGNDFFRSPGVVEYVRNVREKPSLTPVFNGSTVVAKARMHYNCSTLKHVEMDNQPNLDWEGSHLSMRNAKDELMAPVVGAGYYSALTMAIFEDTGFYQADFSKAEAMPWGHKAGCGFLEQKCMANNITRWPQMFCNGSQVGLSCPSDRLGVGVCGIATAEEAALPPYFQYFTDEFISGISPALDYCPFVKQFDEASCNQNSSNATDDANSFNVFSDAARCIDGAFAPKDRSTGHGPILGMCANVKCDNTTNTYSIQVKGSRSYVNCTEGHNITLDTFSSAFESGGYITCPPYVEVCQGNVKAAMDFKAALARGRHISSDGGRGHTPTDSMPSSGSGANKPAATSSNGKGDRLFPLGNGAAGLHSARTLVSAGVALLVMTLTVGLSA